MSEFIVQKKTKCEKCYKGWALDKLTQETIAIIVDGRDPHLIGFADGVNSISARCSCNRGYIYEEVPLTEALDEIFGQRFNEKYGELVPVPTGKQIWFDNPDMEHSTEGYTEPDPTI